MVGAPSEFSSSSASSASSEASSAGTVFYTPSPAGSNRQLSRPPTGVGEFLRAPSTRPAFPRITDDALLEHIWGQSFDDSLFWLRRIGLQGLPQYETAPLSELMPTQNRLPNNLGVRRPVIVDGTTGWRQRQYRRAAANMDLPLLLEEMGRLREEELRILEARRRIANLLPPWMTLTADEPIRLNIPPIPPRQMPVNMEFPLRVLEDTERDNIANGFPQHVRQRSSHVRQRSNQVREESDEDPFSQVNPFRRGRNLPR
ncbi:hypothetical protein B0H65DRAFT_427166 [Neurospora tetraspora]|uniref:Uncharacterized protein n=1 Tax=Neurospora tetraspora TaxID=94610 RepID=A0AAE0JEH3_9PEZI|nr:hypothetical protein B0H65DRAFT_427166 [Neurospora tetraspora]